MIVLSEYGDKLGDMLPHEYNLAVLKQKLSDAIATFIPCLQKNEVCQRKQQMLEELNFIVKMCFGRMHFKKLENSIASL